MIVCPLEIHDAIVEQARAGTPDETCGVLGGEFNTDSSRVTSRYPARNAASDPRRRYRIAPEALLEILEELEGTGEEIVGFYHSHPRGPARPSETDRSSAAWPDRSYVIVSCFEPTADVTSWRWRVVEDGDSDDSGDSRQFERERVVLE